MISAIRILEFDAAHRVVGHESKCATNHGHRYKIEAFCRAKSLDKVGRVIDFSVIKEKLGAWIDEHWDHNTLVYIKDPNLKYLISMSGFKAPYLCVFNPTAENMAYFLLHKICKELFRDSAVEVYKIKLWETPNCFVEVDFENK